MSCVLNPNLKPAKNNIKAVFFKQFNPSEKHLCGTCSSNQEIMKLLFSNSILQHVMLILAYP